MAAPGAGGRGVSWREKETLDLLELWGEEKVQEALTVSHRNIDVFKRIAEQMAVRGHHRSALECRTKSKTLRQEYKRVVTHNARSGNAPVTCLYYAQLHRIFHGDVSIKPQRVARSLSLRTTTVQRSEEQATWEGSEELFSHQTITLNLEGIQTSTLFSSGQSTEKETIVPDVQNNDEQTDAEGICADDQDLTQIEGEKSVVEEEENEADAGSDSGRSVMGTPTAATKLSPAERLEKARTRTRRVAALANVAERILAQAEREERENVRERREKDDSETAWRKALMEAECRRQEEAREDRRAFSDAMRQSMDSISKAVSALTAVTELFLKEQRGAPGPSASDTSCAQRSANQAPKTIPRRRLRTVKHRERFDPSA